MSGTPVRIAMIALPAPGLDALCREATVEGHGFLDRLQSEWDERTNRFDRPGECLLGARAAGRLIGICGLNVDPFAGDPGVGRLRHLYVAQGWRRQAVASRLVDRLLVQAAGSFGRVRLRTDSAAAAAFYVACGFARVEERDATHAIIFD
jgi:GNAT superfamily N-acetyltransferase